MLFVVERIAALARLGEVLFQMQRRYQGGVGVGVQPFAVQKAGDLLFAQLGQEGFTRAGGVHRQLAANRRRHAHQLRTLHLVDDNRLVVALIQHRQVDRFAGVLHQLAQNRVHDGQQVAAL